MSTKEKLSFLDATLMLGVATAVFYYAYYLYEYSYFQAFGINLIDLHLSPQEMLLFNPWLASLIIMLALLVGYVIVTAPENVERKRSNDPRLRAKAILFSVTITCFALIGVLLYLLAQNKAKHDIANSSTVTFKVDDKIVGGYHFLTHTDDSFYFYKPSSGKSPEVLILRADDVKALSYGGTIP